ncbi:MAG: HD domain-containing protein [Bacilli bacterium]
MIDFNKCIELFNEYIKNYDKKEFNIKLKIDHTFRVVNFCEKIAKSLNLSEEDIVLAKVIGLLHDIGRFEQFTKYRTFSDIKSIDHASLGIEILKENNYISKYVEDIELQKVVLIAVDNHNKIKIEDNLNKIYLLFSKIVRDADKLDILDLYKIGDLKIDETEGVISDKVYFSIINELIINKNDCINKIDFDLVSASYIYDFNFGYSYIYISENNSIIWIIDELIKYCKTEVNKLNEIKEKINNYMEKRKFIC